MIIRRPRIKHPKPFQERLADQVRRFRELAEETPHGVKRDFYLRRARQAEIAAEIDSWLASPGLQPPKDIGNLARKSR